MRTVIRSVLLKCLWIRNMHIPATHSYQTLQATEQEKERERSGERSRSRSGATYPCPNRSSIRLMFPTDPQQSNSFSFTHTDGMQLLDQRQSGKKQQTTYLQYTKVVYSFEEKRWEKPWEAPQNLPTPPRLFTTHCLPPDTSSPHCHVPYQPTPTSLADHEQQERTRQRASEERDLSQALELSLGGS